MTISFTPSWPVVILRNSMERAPVYTNKNLHCLCLVVSNLLNQITGAQLTCVLIRPGVPCSADPTGWLWELNVLNYVPWEKVQRAFHFLLHWGVPLQAFNSFHFFKATCLGWAQQRQQDSLSLTSIFTPFKVTQRSPTLDLNQRLMSKIYEEVYWLIILWKLPGL